MGLSSLSAARGYENTIYLAFSLVVMGLLVKTLFPWALSDLRVAISLTAIGSSLLASLLFYLRPTDWLLAILKRYVLRRRDALAIYCAQLSLIARSWETAVSRLPSPDEQAEHMTDLLDSEPALRTDIWTITGAGLFLVSIPLLGALLDLTDTLWPVFLAMMIAIVLSTGYRYRGFSGRALMAAMSRYLEDVMQADLASRQASTMLEQQGGRGTGDWQTATTPDTEMEYKRQLTMNVAETNRILDRREWKRFETRFESLRNAIDVFSRERLRLTAYDGLVNDWVQVFMAPDEMARTAALTRLDNQKTVLSSLCNLEDSPMVEAIRHICEVDPCLVTDTAELFRHIVPEYLTMSSMVSLAKILERLGDTEQLDTIAAQIASWIGTSTEGCKNTLFMFGTADFGTQIRLMGAVAPYLGERGILAVVRFLTDHDSRVGGAAVRLCGYVDDDNLVELVTPYLETLPHSTSPIAADALSSLANVGKKSVEPRVQEAVSLCLRHREPDVRLRALIAAESLSWPPGVLSGITKDLRNMLLGDKEPYIRVRAARTLSRIAGLDFQYPWLPPQCVALCLGLSLSREESHAQDADPSEVVQALLSSDQRAVHEASAAALSNLEDMAHAIELRDILDLIGAGQESIAVGLLLLREKDTVHIHDGSLLKKLFRLVVDGSELEKLLAAACIGPKRQLFDPFVKWVRHTGFSEQPYVLLTLGCGGNSLLQYPDMVSALEVGIRAGSEEKRVMATYAVGLMGEKIQRYPNVTMTLLESLRGASGLLSMCLLEAIANTCDRHVLPYLEEYLTEAQSMPVYEATLRAIERVQERTVRTLDT